MYRRENQKVSFSGFEIFHNHLKFSSVFLTRMIRRIRLKILFFSVQQYLLIEWKARLIY